MEKFLHAIKGAMEMEEDYLILFQIEPYIDALYVHKKKPYSQNEVYLKRFTYKDGYGWDYEQEQIFYERCLCNEECGFDHGKLDEIFRVYSALHPEWKLQRYYTKHLRLLDHIYHCMKRGTVKEMLYKAELDELAAGLGEMDEVNLLASKPTEIYDGISMRVLRALNCREGAKLLSTAYNRNFLKDLLMKFPEIFKGPLNDAQCSYLNHLITGELTVGETGRLYLARQLSLVEIWNHEQYKLFLHKEKNQNLAKMIMTELGKIDEIYTKNLKFDVREQLTDRRLPELKEYLLVNRGVYDLEIRRSNRKRDMSWQEREHGYVVRYPQTINDFCREAVYMSNCLLAYVGAYISGDTTILFIREMDDVNRPFITMEIFNGELMQAYHRFNEDCTPEEAAWIRDYCARHEIGCTKFKFNQALDELF